MNSELLITSMQNIGAVLQQEQNVKTRSQSRLYTQIKEAAIPLAHFGLETDQPTIKNEAWKLCNALTSKKREREEQSQDPTSLKKRVVSSLLEDENPKTAILAARVAYQRWRETDEPEAYSALANFITPKLKNNQLPKEAFKKEEWINIITGDLTGKGVEICQQLYLKNIFSLDSIATNVSCSGRTRKITESEISLLKITLLFDRCNILSDQSVAVDMCNRYIQALEYNFASSILPPTTFTHDEWVTIIVSAVESRNRGYGWKAEKLTEYLLKHEIFTTQTLNSLTEPEMSNRVKEFALKAALYFAKSDLVPSQELFNLAAKCVDNEDESVAFWAQDLRRAVAENASLPINTFTQSEWIEILKQSLDECSDKTYLLAETLFKEKALTQETFIKLINGTDNKCQEDEVLNLVKKLFEHGYLTAQIVEPICRSALQFDEDWEEAQTLALALFKSKK